MRLNPLLTRLPEYPIDTIIRRRDDRLAAGLPVYDFGLGDPVEPVAEFIAEAARQAVPRLAGYPTVRGPSAVRDAVGAYLDRRFGVAVDPATQVLPTSGSKEAIFHLPLLVVDPAADDRVVVFPDPGYPAYLRGTVFAGGEPHPQPLAHDFRQRLWELPKHALRRARLAILNSPHNPSGAVLDLDDLRRSWEVAREHDILLVNDECYADVYDAEPPPSLLQVSTEGVVVVHSLSKRSGMTGYRAGFLAGDAEVIRQLALLRANPGVAPTALVNAAAAEAWREPEHVEARRLAVTAKRQVLVEFLRSEGLEVACTDAEGRGAGLYVFVRTPPGVTDSDYAAALLDVGVVVTPGAFLGVTGAGAGYVRAALVPDLEGCRAAVVAWARAHRTLGAGSRA